MSQQDEDWGEDEVEEKDIVPGRWENAGTTGGGHDGRLADMGFEEGAVDWPGAGEAPAGSRLGMAREELVEKAGVARRLDTSFATRASAARVAGAFVEDTDPGRYVPGARGRFEATTAHDEDDGRWYVVARFVPEGPRAAFLDAVEWAEGWLAPLVRRPLKAGRYWCPQWSDHPEALERVKALWEAWEAARAEGGNAMSYWWTVHFDAHWGVLADSAAGPFSACARRGQHTRELLALPSDLGEYEAS